MSHYGGTSPSVSRLAVATAYLWVGGGTTGSSGLDLRRAGHPIYLLTDTIICQQTPQKYAMLWYLSLWQICFSAYIADGKRIECRRHRMEQCCIVWIRPQGRPREKCLDRKCIIDRHRVNPLTAKLFNWNFHSLEVVSRWRDPQLQVSENYSDLTKWWSINFKSCCLLSLLSLTWLKAYNCVMC